MPSAALSCACQGPMGCLGPFITAVFNCGNKNLGAFATFLRLGTPFRLRKAETGYREADYLRFYAADLCFGTLRQSLIAKKLQSRPIFCFWPLGGGLEAARDCRAPPRLTYRKGSNAIGEAGLVLSVGWLGFASDALDAVSARSAKRIVFKGMKQ